MAEPTTDRSAEELALERMLGYGEEPAGEEFVLRVMGRVGQERRRRRLILSVFGLVGAAFGVLGASLLVEPIGQLFTALPAIGTMQAALFVTAAVAFYGWFMDEDASLLA